MGSLTAGRGWLRRGPAFVGGKDALLRIRGKGLVQRLLRQLQALLLLGRRAAQTPCVCKKMRMLFPKSGKHGVYLPWGQRGLEYSALGEQPGLK
eukprot:1144583-Pelagomonas_calceolata.AAC.10